MIKKCLICNKDFECLTNKKLYCSKECQSKMFYRNHRIELIQKRRDYEDNNYEIVKEKKKNYWKKWYLQNKEAHKKQVIESYNKNKAKNDERYYTRWNKITILKYLNPLCPTCNLPVKVIHHKEYGHNPRLKTGKYYKQENELKLKEYTEKYLLGFCSKECHRRYEREQKTTRKDFKQ